MTFPRKGLLHIRPILTPPLMKHIRMNIQIQGNFLYGTLPSSIKRIASYLKSRSKYLLVSSNSHDTPPIPRRL